MPNSRIIGIDFDNTIINYDEVIYKEALNRGLIPAGYEKNKTKIRDHLRTLDDGETNWQRIQASVYGPGIMGASISRGFEFFISEGRGAGLVFKIISHKSRYSNLGESKEDLREWALKWMEKHGFFNSPLLGFGREDIFFEQTREEKIFRIGVLKCEAFIDDLEEVLLEDSFPSKVKKILYGPPEKKDNRFFLVSGNWSEILSALRQR